MLYTRYSFFFTLHVLLLILYCFILYYLLCSPYSVLVTFTLYLFTHYSLLSLFAFYSLLFTLYYLLFLLCSYGSRTPFQGAGQVLFKTLVGPRDIEKTYGMIRKLKVQADMVSTRLFACLVF